MIDETNREPLRGLRDLEQRLRGPDIDEGSAPRQFALSIVLPGLAAVRRIPIVGVLLFTVGVAVPLVAAAWVVANSDRLIGVALSPGFLLGVIAVGLAFVVVRLLAVAEVAHAHRRAPGIGGQTAIATTAVLALAVPVLWGVYRANEARSAVADVFGSASSPPLFRPADDDGVDPDDVTNILLFGGDAGPGRWGMRTDTMILVTIHRESERTALLSIPRNLTRLRFPPGSPLASEFPDGFDDLANAVFTHVSGRPELMAHYGAGGMQAEAVAMSQAIGYSLDVEIDDFALVNMQGFADVIDAVGGVTLELAQTVPLPPTLAGERPLPESIGPGLIDMDGALAIAYVRSREADSDYQRMGRQRQLLAALGSQVSTGEALGAFTSVTSLLADSMRTSLSSGEFSYLLDRLGDNSAVRESVGLVPPLVEPGSPDYDQIHTIVDAVQMSVVTGQPSGYGS
jgi:LCP family protein required for cell wall assembly